MKRRVPNVSWNAEERRLRALWRLTLQAVIWIAFGILLGVASAPFAGGWEELASGDFEPGVIPVGLATVASVWVSGRLLDHRRFADYGFHLTRAWFINLAFGLFLGAALMTLVFGVELAVGWVSVTDTMVTAAPDDPFALAVLIPLLTFVVVGISEEVLSRGYHLTNLAEGLNLGRVGPRGAVLLSVLISSTVFGLLHLGNSGASAISTLGILATGVFLAAGFVLTGELAIPIGVHITWNFFQGNVFGFPVSGTDAGPASFLAVEQHGPALWVGGAFGPEAGLLAIGAAAAGVVAIMLWVRFRHGPATLQRSIAAAPSFPNRGERR